MSSCYTFAFALALISLPLAVSAQSQVSGRTAVAVEAPAPATQSSTQQSSAQPATVAPGTQQQDEEETNLVLFTGTVKQDKLKALPGATVYVRSTRQMAVADENGDFSLELDFSRGPLDLEVSYAGFAEQSVKVTDPNTFLVVSMQNRKKK